MKGKDHHDITYLTYPSASSTSESSWAAVARMPEAETTFTDNLYFASILVL